MSLYDICNTAYCAFADNFEKLTGINLIGGEKLESKVAAFTLGGLASYGTTAGLIWAGKKLFKGILKDKEKAEKTMFYIKNGFLVGVPTAAIALGIANQDLVSQTMTNNPVYSAGIAGLLTGIIGGIEVDEQLRIRNQNKEARKQYKEHKQLLSEMKRFQKEQDMQYRI